MTQIVFDTSLPKPLLLALTHSAYCYTRHTARARLLGLALGLLLRLLVLAQRLRQELKKLRVLERLVRLDELGLEPHRRMRDQRRATREKSDREVERGDERVRGRKATRLCLRNGKGENLSRRLT